MTHLNNNYSIEIVRDRNSCKKLGNELIIDILYKEIKKNYIINEISLIYIFDIDNNLNYIIPIDNPNYNFQLNARILNDLENKTIYTIYKKYLLKFLNKNNYIVDINMVLEFRNKDKIIHQLTSAHNHLYYINRDISNINLYVPIQKHY